MHEKDKSETRSHKSESSDKNSKYIKKKSRNER